MASKLSKTAAGKKKNGTTTTAANGTAQHAKVDTSDAALLRAGVGRPSLWQNIMDISADPSEKFTLGDLVGRTARTVLSFYFCVLTNPIR